MRIYIAHPVRKIDPDMAYTLREIVRELELQDHDVYFPLRDTPQDAKETEICKANCLAIQKSDLVIVVWDGLSQGVLFDLGIAFAYGVPIQIAKIPPRTPTKSFQNLLYDMQTSMINLPM